MWQVWPHVTSVTTCDKCDHMWQVLPHVTSVTTLGHHGHLDIWTSWTFGHSKRTCLKILWKFFLLNIWNIVGRRFLRTFPSSLYRIIWMILEIEPGDKSKCNACPPHNFWATRSPPYLIGEDMCSARCDTSADGRVPAQLQWAKEAWRRHCTHIRSYWLTK